MYLLYYQTNDVQLLGFFCPGRLRLFSLCEVKSFMKNNKEQPSDVSCSHLPLPPPLQLVPPSASSEPTAYLNRCYLTFIVGGGFLWSPSQGVLGTSFLVFCVAAATFLSGWPVTRTECWCQHCPLPSHTPTTSSTFAFFCRSV